MEVLVLGKDINVLKNYDNDDLSKPFEVIESELNAFKSDMDKKYDEYLIKKQEEAVLATNVEEEEEITPDVTPFAAKEEAPAPVEPAKAEEPVEVKTTTSLEELEKNLASEANKGKKQTGKKFSRKKKDEEEEESNDSGKSTDTSSATRMAIYTEEELAEFEKEEEELEDTDEDIDYDDYDEYYDDEN